MRRRDVRQSQCNDDIFRENRSMTYGCRIRPKQRKLRYRVRPFTRTLQIRSDETNNKLKKEKENSSERAGSTAVGEE
jgi:hypothetical protein